MFEVDSYESYINEIKEKKCIPRFSCFSGGLYGNTLPRNCKIEDFTYDDCHGKFSLILWNGLKIKHYFQLVIDEN